MGIGCGGYLYVCIIHFFKTTDLKDVNSPENRNSKFSIYLDMTRKDVSHTLVYLIGKSRESVQNVDPFETVFISSITAKRNKTSSTMISNNKHEQNIYMHH